MLIDQWIQEDHPGCPMMPYGKIEPLSRCDHDEDEFNGLCYTKCGWASGCFDFKFDSMGFHGDFMGFHGYKPCGNLTQLSIMMNLVR